MVAAEQRRVMRPVRNEIHHEGMKGMKGMEFGKR